MTNTRTSRDDGARDADAIRTWIVDAIAEALEVRAESIDTTAALDSFGIDSLAAFTMTGDLASWLDRDLPATLLWDHPDVESLCAALARGDDDTRGVPGVLVMRADGSRTPIFFLPGIGGHPVSFRQIAEHLHPDQPAYGFKLPGTDDDEPLTNIEEIATVLITSLRVVQPRGPYQLAGYSLGGLLAYEIAQQLTAAGESVSLLAMYDTFAPGGIVDRPYWQRLGIHTRRLARGPARLAYLRERLRERFGSSAPDPESPLFDDVRRAGRLAARRYVPRPYPGRVVLFRASEPEPYHAFMRVDTQHGWGPLAGGVDVISLPGSHLTLFHGDRNEVVARELERCLMTVPEIPADPRPRPRALADDVRPREHDWVARRTA